MKPILTVIAVCVFSFQLRAQVSFTLSSSPVVGSAPQCVTAADINGDNRVDLISASQDHSTLSVLTNDGSGGFVLASSPIVGNQPFSVVAADVNGDGKLDLASANFGDSTLTVLTNDGSGGFVLASTLNVGSRPFSVVAADVNGDGKVDLISANISGNTLSVLTNNGSGGFVTSGTYAVGSYPWGLTAADVNGDGKVDLICGNSGDSSLSVLTNDGSGGFVLASSPVVGYQPLSVVSADVNGDGKVDLICPSQDSTLSVLTNDGSGGFVTSGAYALGSVPETATAADVNGDGKVDLIWGSQNGNTLSVLTNTGSGGFVTSGTWAVGVQAQSVTAADVNADGKVDLVCANYRSSDLSVLTNATPFPPTTLPVITSQPQSQTIVQGTAASFTVTAMGAAPLNYQWQFYGTNISGATNSSLAFTDAQLTNAGVYSVVVSNSLGSVTSSNAVLQVLPLDAPSIQVNGVLAVGTMTVTASAQVSISGGFSGGYIFYTLDGNVPSVDSPLYTGAITLTNSATVQAMSLSVDLSQTAFAPVVNVMIVPVYNLQTAVVGNGTITANPVSGPYLSNSVVTLTATPAANWLFDNWTGDASGSQNPLSLTMNGPLSVQAVFSPIPLYSLNTSVVGNGTLSVNPPNSPYLSNSVVSVTATASAGWLFDHWTGDASGSQNPLSLTMTGPLSVQAVFVQIYPITVSTPGGGSVTVNGQVIAPGTFYPVGSILNLAATASSGWTFLGWRGNASGTNNPLSLAVNQANNIQAIFGTAVATNALGGGSIVLSQPNPIPFGTTLTASAVPNAGNYFVTWGGTASGTSAPTTITVTSANPTISALFTTLPAGKYSLGVVVSGNGSVTISPQKNYYNPGDSVALSALGMAITNILGTNYYAFFYGWTQDASGTNSSITVLMNTNKIVQANFGVLPIVSIVPTNLIVEVGSNAVLSANAAGLPPLTYQWQNSQGAIINATNAFLTITNAQPTNADNYSVVVSNPYGSVTSVVATVTVAFPPSITSQSVGQTVAAGTPVTLSVTNTGTAPLYYQWVDSLGPISGATNASFSLNPAQTNNWDNYFVEISNAYGAVTSAIIPLIVYGPVSITAQPMSQVVPLDAPATFVVIASGFPTPLYQWALNGTNLVGASSNTLTITNVDFPNLGYYQVLVYNGYSSTNSYVAALDMSPSLATPFTGATTIWGKSATLSVGAVGSGQLGYQWYLNGVPIDGATSATLDFSNIQFTNAGLYSVVVSSPYGTITNAAYQVVVNPAGVSLGFSPTLTISGVPGYSYIIQRSTNLGNTNAWTTVTNLTLTQPIQLWVDTNVDASSPFNPKTFYKILPGQ